MRAFHLLVLIVVVVALCGAQAQKPRGRGRGGGRGRGRGRSGLIPEDASRWEREVDGQMVEQRGFANQTTSRVTIVTPGQRILRNLSLIPSLTLFDFGDANNPVAVIRVRKACLLLPSPAALDFPTVSTEVNNRNGTDVTTAASPVQLNGTNQPLTKDGVANQTESVRRFCRRAEIIQTESPSAPIPAPGKEEGGQMVITFLTLDDKVSILVNKPSRGSRGRGGPRGPGGPGGRGGRGGRRGSGGPGK